MASIYTSEYKNCHLPSATIMVKNSANRVQPIRIELTIRTRKVDRFTEEVAIKNQHGRFSTRKRHFVAGNCEKFGLASKML